MNIIFIVHCVGRTFFGRGEPGYFHSFDWCFKFGSYEQVQVSSKKVVTFPLVPVQQGLWDCIMVLLMHLGNFMGYPTRCKFAVTHNIVQNVERSFVTYSRLQLLNHAQSICDQHPTGKQGVELCCSPREVVLYGGCPEGYPAFPERFNPSCYCAMWKLCIGTCFTQSLKTFLYTTTSCHFNFDSGALL